MSSGVHLLGRNFDLGFQSDVSRDELPPNAAFRLRDFMPQIEAAIRKRGGWTHATRDLGIAGGATRGSGVGWSLFPNDPHLISVDEVGRVYRTTVFDGTNATLIGSTHGEPLTHRPFWHKDRMIVLPQLGGAAANVYKYYDTGSLSYTTAALGGTPPQARVGLSWGDYLLLANGYVGGTLYANRIWNSAVGNPDSWTPGTNFWDMPDEIVVMAKMRQFILVWGYGSTWMITGDTPPDGGNWATRDLFRQTGCMDGRTLVLYRDYAIWANNQGVFKSDGVTLTDLTKVGGISLYWRSLISSFNFQKGWSAAAGLDRGEYTISIFNASGTLVTTLKCDIERQTWHEFTNVPAAMYAERTSGPGTATADGSEELFFAHRTLPRAEYMSSCWTPAMGNANDADGTAVLPSLETPFYKQGSAIIKRARRLYVSYDLRTGGGSPYLTVSKITSPEDTNYVACTPTLATTTKFDRKAVEVRRKALGFGFKIAQTGASADTRIGELEFEGHPEEPSK